MNNHTHTHTQGDLILITRITPTVGVGHVDGFTGTPPLTISLHEKEKEL